MFCMNHSLHVCNAKHVNRFPSHHHHHVRPTRSPEFSYILHETLAVLTVRPHMSLASTCSDYRAVFAVSVPILNTDRQSP